MDQYRKRTTVKKKPDHLANFELLNGDVIKEDQSEEDENDMLS